MEALLVLVLLLLAAVDAVLLLLLLLHAVPLLHAVADAVQRSLVAELVVAACSADAV